MFHIQLGYFVWLCKYFVKVTRRLFLNGRFVVLLICGAKHGVFMGILDHEYEL